MLSLLRVCYHHFIFSGAKSVVKSIRPAMEISMKLTPDVNGTNTTQTHPSNKMYVSKNLWDDIVGEEDEIFNFMAEAAEDAYYCGIQVLFFLILFHIRENISNFF